MHIHFNTLTCVKNQKFLQRVNRRELTFTENLLWARYYSEYILIMYVYVNMLAVVTDLKATHTIYHGAFEIYAGMNGANYYIKNSSSLSLNLKVTSTTRII